MENNLFFQEECQVKLYCMHSVHICDYIVRIEYRAYRQMGLVLITQICVTIAIQIKIHGRVLKKNRNTGVNIKDVLFKLFDRQWYVMDELC